LLKENLFHDPLFALLEAATAEWTFLDLDAQVLAHAFSECFSAEEQCKPLLIVWLGCDSV